MELHEGNAHGITYDITARRVAEASYHTSKVTVHENPGRDTPSLREEHTSSGVLLQFEISGRFGRFSWQALADEFVLKLGWLTLLQLVLDLIWQYFLPRLGIDYNRDFISGQWVDATMTAK
eukprot:TRINITY_DN51026_c0_g1_i1.p1 TRINITY_DN51026_c0_g1~~TRINITY_DN51026_c0_g1_i1.p1  ORF type:complete len:139 (-),score=15.66 TRINITY_DN51026_c0_g1_i1:33-395(-)